MHFFFSFTIRILLNRQHKVDGSTQIICVEMFKLILWLKRFASGNLVEMSRNMTNCVLNEKKTLILYPNIRCHKTRTRRNFRRLVSIVTTINLRTCKPAVGNISFSTGCTLYNLIFTESHSLTCENIREKNNK